VKMYIVQDVHYASALFHYEKEMVIQFTRFVTFVSFDNKHKVPLREPGHHWLA